MVPDICITVCKHLSGQWRANGTITLPADAFNYDEWRDAWGGQIIWIGDYPSQYEATKAALDWQRDQILGYALQAVRGEQAA